MDSQIYFITGNKNKFREASNLIPNLKQLEIDLTEIQDIDPKTIIESKIQEARKQFNGKILCEDVSLEIESLNGFPGPLIKWYLQCLKPEGIYNNLVSENKNAIAKATLAYYDGKNTHFFEGIVKGELVSPKKDSFGFDPIFKPKGYDKTYSEMDLKEKNQMSHRALAFKKFQEYLNSQE